MNCPNPECGGSDTFVLDSRKFPDRVYRRRECRDCRRRCTTWEMPRDALIIMMRGLDGLQGMADGLLKALDAREELTENWSIQTTPPRRPNKPKPPTAPDPAPAARSPSREHRRAGIQAMLRAAADAQRDGLDDELYDHLGELDE